jgi:hypothetical protein
MNLILHQYQGGKFIVNWDHVRTAFPGNGFPGTSLIFDRVVGGNLSLDVDETLAQLKALVDAREIRRSKS